jgi:TPR repeat protein
MNNSYAQYNMAVLHIEGYGFKKDLSKGAEWLALSAAQGLPAAEFNLGMMYLLGKGVERDSLQAERLFRQASAQGHKYATSYLLKLEEKRITPADSIMDLKVMAN